MKSPVLSISAYPFLFLLSAFLFSSWTSRSEEVKDESAGTNGSFEVFNDGIPVNWIVYSPKTVEDADFTIVFDTEKVKEGKQSLRYDIKSCGSVGGWKSPGIAQQFEVDPARIEERGLTAEAAKITTE